MSKKSQEYSWRYSTVTSQTPEEGRTILDLVRTSFKPSCHIKKISKNEYIKGRYKEDGTFVTDKEIAKNLETGEEEEFTLVYTFAEKGEHMRNRRSLRQIFRTLRQLIGTNFKGGDSELFLTLTYAEQTNDASKIYNDLDKFWKRLKYKHQTLKYIAIVEPHATGMFHIHMLLADTTGQPLFIPWEELKETWGHGMIEIDRLEDIDHMGAYFIAYFSNLELTPDEVTLYEEQDDIVEKNGKKYIKGKRLDYYPEHMRIYRHSRNCDKPSKLTGYDADAALIGAQLKYQHETTFEDEGTEYHILTAQYVRENDAPIQE